MSDATLKREDYEEPACLLCMRQGAEPIPLSRVIEKLDDYFHHKRFSEAERHLLYWLSEAEAVGDLRGQFALQNELMGFYRKQGQKTQAIAHAEAAVALIDKLDNADSIGAATAYVNTATVYQNFDLPEQALPWFLKALPIYEENLAPSDKRLGALYNNCGLTLAALGRFDEARASYEKALSVMARVEYGKPEMAMTYLNMADALTAQLGAEAAEKPVQEYLDRAYELICDEAAPRDGYYAFVCEKCAASFGYYGCFLQEAELMKRVREILEGT